MTERSFAAGCGSTKRLSYGWAPIIIAIPPRDYLSWGNSRPGETEHRIKGWTTRSDSFLRRISKYPPFEPGLFQRHARASFSLLESLQARFPGRLRPRFEPDQPGSAADFALDDLSRLIVVRLRRAGSSAAFFAVHPVLGETAALTSAPEFKCSMARDLGKF